MLDRCSLGLCFGLTLILFLILSEAPCFAHKINVFASAEGEMITGYVYTRAERIRNQKVLIQDTKGNLLGETTTNENGEFTFKATLRCDYMIIVETADGHYASFTVSADELPETLPSSISAQPGAENEQKSSEVSSAETALSEKTAESNQIAQISQGISVEELEQAIEKSVSRQIRPLREQLEAYEAKIRLHDTLGGIGYILGLMGLVFYFLGRRRKNNTSSSNPIQKGS